MPAGLLVSSPDLRHILTHSVEQALIVCEEIYNIQCT